MHIDSLQTVKNLNEIILTPNHILTIKRESKTQAQLFDGWKSVGHLAINVKLDEIIYINRNVDLFKKFNALGVISELITNDIFCFEKMIFLYKNMQFNSTKKTFKKNGIVQSFSFGTKIFLPLQYFNDNQLSFDFTNENSNCK